MTDHTHECCDAHDHEHDHAYLHAHGIPHSHGHVHENQKAVLNRLSRAIGHLEKVKRMVEEGHDCSEVLIQLAAVRSALDNIGGHNEMRNIDIVKIICKALGKPESLITYVTDRKGHDMRYAIDPTKIHRELGWLPETKFADGIQKTIRWYLDNRAWWETIISGEYRDYYEKMYGNR